MARPAYRAATAEPPGSTTPPVMRMLLITAPAVLAVAALRPRTRSRSSR
ncbi:hypothetical protein AB0O07_05050 [Streptomyces sp. NPDC093085]